MMGRRIAATALLAIVATAVALLGAELAVRWVFRDLTTTSPIDSYFGLRWKERHLRRNQWGFREREFGLSKPPGFYRVAVIGDSNAVAMGPPEQERFSELIEASLDRDSRRFEILNFANPGAETHNEVRVLRELVLSAEPDFVLLQWYPNDFEYSKEGRPQPPRTLARDPHLHRRLYRSSALYILLNHAWQSLQISQGWVVRFEDYMRARFGDPESVDSRTAMAQLERFVLACSQAEVPLGIVLFPRPTKKLSAYPLAFIHERVLALCEERGIPCLDLTPTYAPYADRMQQIWLNRFDHHFSALAHRLAAERILATFREHWGAIGVAEEREEGVGSAQGASSR